MDSNAIEVTGRWEELVSRPEFRGHQVKITIVEQAVRRSGGGRVARIPSPNGEQRRATHAPGG